MKLPDWRILEIAKITRRQSLKIAAAAVFSAVLPQTTKIQKYLTIKSAKLEKTLQKLAKDHRYRNTFLLNPARYMANLRLNTNDKRILKNRIKMFEMAIFTLSFKIMQRDKGIRPILLSPARRRELFFKTRASKAIRLTRKNSLTIRKLKNTANSIGDYIFDLPADYDTYIRTFTPVQRSGWDDDSDLACGTDEGCDNSTCADSGCDDNHCQNIDCADYGCSNPGCINEICNHENCSNTKSCNDVVCEKFIDFDNLSGDRSGCFISDEIFKDIVNKFAKVIDQGPPMDFLVRIDNKTIRSNVVINPLKLKAKLQPFKLKKKTRK